MVKKRTQKQKVLHQLEHGHTLSSLEAAMNLGIMNLPQRITELRLDGHDIRMRWEQRGGPRYGRWYMAGKG